MLNWLGPVPHVPTHFSQCPPGAIFTTLEHRYLAENGFPNVRHVFGDATIPTFLKNGAFLHGFLVVVVVLLVLNFVSAIVSAMNKGGMTDAAGAEAARVYVDSA